MPVAARGFWDDASFRTLISRNPQLAGLTAHLGHDCSFDGRRHVRSAHSSYQHHHYDLFFYALVRVLRPQRCLELGVLEGFSLLAMASALRDNGCGHVTGYDLFEDYPFRHASSEDVKTRCREAQLDPFVTLRQGSADDAFSEHLAVDVLHIDLSNDGDTYRNLFSQWAARVTRAILLEGGSLLRDRVPWMQNNNKPQIGTAIGELRSAYNDWSFSVVEPFPSITLALRR
jgi:predicted O-methyltransferase YrrM